MEENKLKCEVKLTELEPFKTLLSSVVGLVRQIALSEYKDENGMALKNNVKYLELMETIMKIGKEDK